MSQQTVHSSVGRTMRDYIDLAANIAYVLAIVSFLTGLYVDWQRPGAVVIPPLSITNSPSNSGLFILAILLLIVGFIISKIGNIVEERQREEVDQTQEWTVDVGSDRP